MVSLSVSKGELFGLQFNPELLNSLFGNDKTVDAVQLKTGAEADKIIKLTSSKGIFVIKQIQPVNANEEANHIGIINSIYPDFFPKLHALDSKQGIYAMDFIVGNSLESIVSYPKSGDMPEKDLIYASLKKLNTLHKQTIKPYSSEYHKIIVNKRIYGFIDCPIVKQHAMNIGAEQLVTTNTNGKPFAYFLQKALNFYENILPTIESIIHGDSHLGNIIANNGDVKFIDPRVRWDFSPNKEVGYFDPLYDVACLTHSLIANAILQIPISSKIDEENKLISFNQWAFDIFDKYTNKSFSTEEKNRYIIYLACCLLGNLRYKEFTPNPESFNRTVNSIAYLIHKNLNN